MSKNARPAEEPRTMAEKVWADHVVAAGDGEPEALKIDNPPAALLMVGLQGSGKTTTTAKIGLRLTARSRRKVLLGALVLHRLENGKDEEFSRRLGEWLKRELPDFLTRPGDKELFADLIGNAPTGGTAA